MSEEQVGKLKDGKILSPTNSDNTREEYMMSDLLTETRLNVDADVSSEIIEMKKNRRETFLRCKLITLNRRTKCLLCCITVTPSPATTVEGPSKRPAVRSGNHETY